MELGTFKRDFKMLVSKFSGNTQALLKNKAFLAGGAIRSLYLQEKPKDYDLFFLDTTACYEVIEAAREKGLVLHSSSSAVTLKSEEGQVPFQFIRLDFGSPTDVIGRFDFTCNMNFYMPANDWGRIQYPDSISTKTLVFNPKASTPLSALIRANRFMHKGWDVSDLQFARIGVAISKLKPITSGEQMKNLGLSEYSGPYVQNLDIGQVLSDELHPRSTRDESSDSFSYRNFTMESNIISPAARSIETATSLSGMIQRVNQIESGRVTRRGEAMAAIPERRTEVASQPEAPTRMLNADTHRWWNTTDNVEVARPAAPTEAAQLNTGQAMTRESFSRAVEQLRNSPAISPDEVPF